MYSIFCDFYMFAPPPSKKTAHSNRCGALKWTEVFFCKVFRLNFLCMSKICLPQRLYLYFIKVMIILGAVYMR